MERLTFKTTINAPVAKVWNTMLNDETYRQWTSAFHEGSYYKGVWSAGSKMLFLGPNDDGSEGGMVSMVKENRLHEYISLQHIGLVGNGIEDTTSEEARKWSPAFENYTFVEKDGVTELTVELDTLLEYKEMFENMWLKALEKLKEIAES